MKATIRYVYARPLQDDRGYLSVYVVVLDCDARQRRVRMLSDGAYVHVRGSVLFLQSRELPKVGDTFASEAKP